MDGDSICLPVHLSATLYIVHCTHAVFLQKYTLKSSNFACLSVHFVFNILLTLVVLRLNMTSVPHFIAHYITFLRILSHYVSSLSTGHCFFAVHELHFSPLTLW